jgi:hypothetical protein
VQRLAAGNASCPGFRLSPFPRRRRSRWSILGLANPRRPFRRLPIGCAGAGQSKKSKKSKKIRRRPLLSAPNKGPAPLPAQSSPMPSLDDVAPVVRSTRARRETIDLREHRPTGVASRASSTRCRDGSLAESPFDALVGVGDATLDGRHRCFADVGGLLERHRGNSGQDPGNA